MHDELGFLLSLAASPNDLTAHLVYADWLQEQDDPGAECVRAWVDLVQHPYHDSTYRDLILLFEQFRATLQHAEPEWVKVVAETRPWVSAELAERAVRLYLRVRHGRKVDRQWVEPPVLGSLSQVWYVSYWRNESDRSRPRPWRDRPPHLVVDPVTAEVQEAGKALVGCPPDSTG